MHAVICHRLKHWSLTNQSKPQQCVTQLQENLALDLVRPLHKPPRQTKMAASHSSLQALALQVTCSCIVVVHTGQQLRMLTVEIIESAIQPTFLQLPIKK